MTSTIVSLVPMVETVFSDPIDSNESITEFNSIEIMILETNLITNIIYSLLHRHSSILSKSTAITISYRFVMATMILCVSTVVFMIITTS